MPYIVDTDASDYGIGGVLSQCIEGTEHVIAYYSKSLNPAQQKYCTTRRELLAVVATLDHFKGYIWGPKFVVRTDHAALVWLKNLKNIQGMLARNYSNSTLTLYTDLARSMVMQMGCRAVHSVKEGHAHPTQTVVRLTQINHMLPAALAHLLIPKSYHLKAERRVWQQS